MATTIHSEITEIPAFHVPSVSQCGAIGLFSYTGFVLFTSYTCLGDRWFIKVDTTLGLSSMRHGVWTMCTQVFYFAHFSREYSTQNTPASAHFNHFSLQGRFAKNAMSSRLTPRLQPRHRPGYSRLCGIQIRQPHLHFHACGDFTRLSSLPSRALQTLQKRT